ncbi:MAG TPA: HAMP domain-containing sensor histidine kinase [Rhizomicrobium sp.]
MAAIALSPVHAAAHIFSGAMRTATRHVRWTVLISIVLIFGSFVCAAVIQMRLDRVHALNQATAMEARRAGELAADYAAMLDRYAALGTAFANATPNAETSAALSEAGGASLENLVVLDGTGQLMFEMTREPKDILPLDATTLARAGIGRVTIPAARGRSILLGFPVNGKIALVQLAATQLLPSSDFQDDLLSTPDGRALAMGRAWRELPSYDALALRHGRTETRILELPSGRRLLALAHVPNWPVTVGASLGVGEALSGWYGALPLYFFFILGPAFAGGGLAVVFVREFERRARFSDAARVLKAKKNDEAKLLIRLADAERRAVEADRSKAEFLTHMSHELRTPLNAIIGFAEVIEQGMFGKPGHPKYEEYARDIRDAGRKLHAQIGDVLEFANLEAGRHPIKLVPLDTVPIARQAAEEIAGRAFSRKIKLSIAFPESAFAVADGYALKRALTNLLSNALQFTQDEGAIRAQITCSDSDVLIRVQDNGFGFTAGEAAQAATPFTHFKRPGTSTGTGLGLAIVTSLARRMGGSLKVTGKIGEGAVAELKLRRA